MSAGLEKLNAQFKEQMENLDTTRESVLDLRNSIQNILYGYEERRISVAASNRGSISYLHDSLLKSFYNSSLRSNSRSNSRESSHSSNRNISTDGLLNFFFGTDKTRSTENYAENSAQITAPLVR